MKRADERRPLQLADARWVLERHQTCADCLRPQRFDYSADDAQWSEVVGAEVCLCVECYLRRCDALGARPLIGGYVPRTAESFSPEPEEATLGKRRDTEGSESFWAYVERTAKTVLEEWPEWKRRHLRGELDALHRALNPEDEG